MLKMLHPNQHMSQEIDYLLVIKMLKTLAIGAKMVSAEITYNSGAAAADKILSQADLLALLADRGCLLLMQGILSQSIYIDATVLRRLRDKLLQSEQWELALEVSTKAGLDNTGKVKTCFQGSLSHIYFTSYFQFGNSSRTAEDLVSQAVGSNPIDFKRIHPKLLI